MNRIPVCLLLLGALSGCARDGVANRALEAAGLRQPAAEMEKSPHQVRLRLHAAPRLNSDAQGRPLALVTRIYTLRQAAAFEAAPYAAFLTPGAEREAFGADLVGVREVIVVPGQRMETIENVPREAAYVGVVALFHSPAPQRWRLAFASPEAERSGLTLGLQSCALSAGAGAQPIGGARATGSARCQ
ncbi:type VI secretion system lipoprotein TssJ [Massilia sp. GCM10023247]|uniref:type VI secretion system lipoprotein TssJ n=1 Tax=Massilia sp. GCM10023247 TaxID=3252643 RepID=UPI00361792AF